MIDMNFVDYLKAMQDQMPMQQESNSKLATFIRQWVADNIKIIAYIIPVFMAFASRRMFFRKQELNFLEHSVPLFYVLGHYYWLTTVEAIVFYYTGKTIGSGTQMLLVSVYLGFAYTSFVPTQPKWKTFLKGVGIYFTGYVIMMIVTMLFAVAVGFTMAWLFPESLDMIRPSTNH